MPKSSDPSPIEHLGPQFISDTYLDTLQSACLCRQGHFRLRQWPTQPEQQPSKEDLSERIQTLAVRLDTLLTCLHAQGKHRVLILLQGPDTAGKDGCAKALMSGLHPMAVRMASFKAPTAEENARDFLWRVHQQVPRDGECVIFNRSHYDALFVPMVNSKPETEWIAHSIEQVKAFEKMLTETGTVIIKLFLHLSEREQHLRLVERWNNPMKRWKLTPADLQAAEKFSLYTQVHEHVVEATHSNHAPWWIVPADHKGFRNQLVLEIVVGVLERLQLSWPKADPEVKASGFWKA